MSTEEAASKPKIEKPKKPRNKYPNGWKFTHTFHQIDYFAWVKKQRLIDPRYEYIISYPAGGWRDGKAASRMEAEGATTGYPDIMIDWPALLVLNHIGMRLELKRGKDPVRPDQVIWHERLRRAGYYVAVAYSTDELRDYTINYMKVADPYEA